MVPIITACICTHERYDVLADAVESVLSQTLDPSNYRILVIDNSPDADRARAFADEFLERHPRLEVSTEFHWQSPPGLSRARNAALSCCGTPLIAYLDDDAIADPRWLARLVAAFDTFGSDAAVAGGRVEPLWEEPPPAWLSKVHFDFLSIVDYGEPVRAVKAPHWLAGTNIAFRCDALELAGGFDEKLGRSGGESTLLSNEELALVRYFRSEERATIYVHDAVVQHRIPASRLTQAWFRRRAAWQAVSDYLLDPAASARRAGRQWPQVQDFLGQLPPSQRGPQAFMVDIEDPQLCGLQLQALMVFTLASLSGFEKVRSPGG